MKVPLSIAAAVLLATLQSVFAVAGDSTKVLRIAIVATNGTASENTPAEWAYTLEKYGLTAKPEDWDLASDATTKVPLVDVRLDRQYHGEVRIGFPPQTVRLQFDTGSSRLAVSASECYECAGVLKYKRAASKTYNRGVEKPFRITYGHRKSFVSGVMGQDRVTLGSLTVQHQDLSIVLDESRRFEQSVDGILGLSLGEISGYKTVFQNLVEQGLVSRGIFAFYLGKQYLSGGGEAIFGDVDFSRVAAGRSIVYTRVTDPTRWMVHLEDALVEGRSLRGFVGRGQLEALIDTGTTLLVLPKSIADWVNEQIPNSQVVGGKWTVPCDTTSGLEFKFEGTSFLVPARDVAREQIGQPGRCYSAVQTSSGNYMVIGDAFIKNNYVVFDADNRMVGFAPLKL
ncbi:Vacuolar protease A [Mortierella alpina]|uniref:rhizopuspepsin n=1 Tax=Mortierella alpina TaxID=64518 RepID=A0A9P6M127_MORAP|nr:Vacuolar protease A [Mortierella alpina]